MLIRRSSSEPAPAVVERVIWIVTAAGLLATSFLVTPETLDTFRFSKQLVATAEAILLAAVLLVALIYRCFAWPSRWWRDPAMALPPAIVLWTATATLTSTQRVLSGRTLVWVAACAVIFVAAYLTAERRSFAAVALVIAAAAANAIVALLQESGRWNPFLPPKQDLPHHLYTSGFIGNPDDLGSFLVAPLLCAVALLLTDGRRRWWGAAGVVTIAAGLAAAQSMAALAATAAGVLVMTAMRSRRAVIIALVAAVIGSASMLATFTGVREKARSFPPLIRQIGRGADPVLAFENLSSNRVMPLLAGWQMFVRRPLTGVGPGCFTSEYLFEAICAQIKHPSLRESPTAYFHFGEAHNDHVQTLAVSGLPGYTLFLAAPLALLLRARRGGAERRGDEEEDERRAFARLCGPPMAVAFLVLSFFQFPLELAAVMGMFLFVAAIVMRWSGDVAAD